MGRKIVILTFAFLVCASLLASTAGAQSSAMKRGRDWMSMGRYQEAIGEFRQAIEEEPRNVEARYQIARCYHLEGDPLQAIRWLKEALSLSPQHPGALALRSTIQTQGLQLLRAPEGQLQYKGLRIIEELPIASAVSGLKLLMASDYTDIADKARALLLRIDSKQERAAWVSWLTSENVTLREKGAQELWTSERYPDAASILREKNIRTIEKFKGWVGWDAAPAKALADLGWSEALPILMKFAEQYRDSPVAVWFYKELVTRREISALPWIRKLVEVSATQSGEKLDWYSGSIFCLGRLGEKSDEELLRKALGRVLNPNVNLSGMFSFDEPQKEVTDALASITGDPQWNSIPFEGLLPNPWGTGVTQPLDPLHGNAFQREDLVRKNLSHPALFDRIVALIFDSKYAIENLRVSSVVVHTPIRFDLTLEGLRGGKPVIGFVVSVRPKSRERKLSYGESPWEIVEFKRNPTN